MSLRNAALFLLVIGLLVPVIHTAWMGFSASDWYLIAMQKKVHWELQRMERKARSQEKRIIEAEDKVEILREQLAGKPIEDPKHAEFDRLVIKRDSERRKFEAIQATMSSEPPDPNYRDPTFEVEKLFPSIVFGLVAMSVGFAALVVAARRDA